MARALPEKDTEDNGDQSCCDQPYSNIVPEIAAFIGPSVSRCACRHGIVVLVDVFRRDLAVVHTDEHRGNCVIS